MPEPALGINFARDGMQVSTCQARPPSAHGKAHGRAALRLYRMMLEDIQAACEREGITTFLLLRCAFMNTPKSARQACGEPRGLYITMSRVCGSEYADGRTSAPQTRQAGAGLGRLLHHHTVAASLLEAASAPPRRAPARRWLTCTARVDHRCALPSRWIVLCAAEAGLAGPGRGAQRLLAAGRRFLQRRAAEQRGQVRLTMHAPPFRLSRGAAPMSAQLWITCTSHSLSWPQRCRTAVTGLRLLALSA